MPSGPSRNEPPVSCLYTKVAEAYSPESLARVVFVLLICVNILSVFTSPQTFQDYHTFSSHFGLWDFI